jgi:hypothetical protein
MDLIPTIRGASILVEQVPIVMRRYKAVVNVENCVLCLLDDVPKNINLQNLVKNEERDSHVSKAQVL